MAYNGIINGKNFSSEEISAQRIYALLYKLSSDIERLEILLRAIKKRTEAEEKNEQ